MRTLHAALVLVALVAGTAQASILESTTGRKIQFDGGVPGDSSDTCHSPSPTLVADSQTTGLTVPIDDMYDNYRFDVTAAMVGRTVTIRLESFPLLHGEGPRIDGLPSAPAPPVAAPPPSVSVHRLLVLSPACRVPIADSAIDSDTQTAAFTPMTTGYVVVRVVQRLTPEARIDPSTLLDHDPLSDASSVCAVVGAASRVAEAARGLLPVSCAFGAAAAPGPGPGGRFPRACDISCLSAAGNTAIGYAVSNTVA